MRGVRIAPAEEIVSMVSSDLEESNSWRLENCGRACEVLSRPRPAPSPVLFPCKANPLRPGSLDVCVGRDPPQRPGAAVVDGRVAGASVVGNSTFGIHANFAKYVED